MNKILIIDDDHIVRKIVEKSLKKNGYEVICAYNGKNAVELISDSPPDLIITDILMPEKDGVELITEMKREYLGMKIIAMSGGGRINAENHLKIAKQLGADATLSKPFTTDLLLSTVNEVLENN